MKPSQQTKTTTSPLPNFSGKDTATLKLLEKWRREDITGDPAAIARAQAEVDDFKRQMNENRVDSGGDPIL